MRLFTAIDLPQPVLTRVERLLSALRGEAQLKWSPVDNLHITTKFIGEWPEARLGELTEALACLPQEGALEIGLKQMGWFPHERAPLVLYLAVERNPALTALAERTSECLARLGVPPETRSYAPHLTLARVKHPVPLGRLKERLAELQAAEVGRFPVSSYALYRSDRGSNASVYRKLKEFRLEAAMAAS